KLGKLEGADPTLIDTSPRPDFWFQGIFAVLALLPPYMETFLIMGFPVLAAAVLILLPFISGDGEKSWKRRPFSMITLMFILVTITVLTYLAYIAPWSPVMNAWSGIPTPVNYVKARSPLELQGAMIVQNKQCRNCHSLEGRGGKRGPELDDVATRLTRDQLIRQVVQGGGNMPAYGKNLSPSQVTAVTSFLMTMHPQWEREPIAEESDTPRPTSEADPPVDF
ncbi:MAG: c-type cytochrome, partial [Planctomycetaceae bacterium]|nr:c-type cytochrome [Planctomycetaceae bacterium]